MLHHRHLFLLLSPCQKYSSFPNPSTPTMPVCFLLSRSSTHFPLTPGSSPFQASMASSVPRYFYLILLPTLTKLLLDDMKRTAKETGIQGRIVNVSSLAHKYSYSGGIRFNNLNEESGSDILFSFVVEKYLLNLAK